MPHKRSKASVRNERKKNINLPAQDSDLNHDAPKAFTRLMRMKDQMQQKNSQKKDKKESEKATAPTIQAGERMKDFAIRVENEYRSEVNKAYKDSKPLTDRKKRNRQARKEKEANKKQKIVEKYGGRDFDDLKDNVKFGEVADAPPIFKKLPKARGQNKQILEAKNQQAALKKKTTTGEDDTNNNGYESEEDENMKALKASHKRKLANMSAAAKKALEEERERTISMYRAKKAKKMEEDGLMASHGGL
ncbi:hypothetical protein [Absidia glauca]|uniref:Uncharacterized protein n=1 Tax=Absidia glauca TaxID=4829 RepID=A0A163IZ40_ABSGL|nr:hypothetical protein [Absidia glauca]